MKLRNKKTGEIVEPFGISCVNGRTFVQFDDNNGTIKFVAHSLAELNEEWEDYEEPKEHYFITEYGGVFSLNEYKGLNNVANPEDYKAIGNYFETEEEAEKAVEKLKAWKRLKDKGFKFNGWKRDERFYGDYTIEAQDYTTCSDKDLDTLFGGEE